MTKIQTFVKLKDYKKIKMIGLFICWYIQIQGFFSILQFPISLTTNRDLPSADPISIGMRNMSALALMRFIRTVIWHFFIKLAMKQTLVIREKDIVVVVVRTLVEVIIAPMCNRLIVHRVPLGLGCCIPRYM